MEQSKQCRIHRDYYSLKCKDCQYDMKYNYLYNSDCNRCRGQLAYQAFTKRNYVNMIKKSENVLQL